jgi:hypothetical protein
VAKQATEDIKEPCRAAVVAGLRVLWVIAVLDNFLQESRNIPFVQFGQVSDAPSLSRKTNGRLRCGRFKPVCRRLLKLVYGVDEVVIEIFQPSPDRHATFLALPLVGKIHCAWQAHNAVDVVTAIGAEQGLNP